MTTFMTDRSLDEKLRELVARHAAAHHRRAEKLHFAETGTMGPIDEDRELVSEVMALLKLARPELDGDEQGAIQRLIEALESGDPVVKN